VKGSRERELPSSKALEHSLSPPRRVRGLETPSTDRHDGQRSSSFVAPRRAALPEGPRVLSAVPTPARATGIAPFRPPGLPLVHAASLRHCSREERLCYRPALAPGPDGPSILGGLVRSSACTEVLAHASLSVVIEYLALRDGPRRFRPGFTCPTLLGYRSRGPEPLTYGTVTRCGATFQWTSVKLDLGNSHVIGPTTPGSVLPGLGWSPFARRY